MFKFNFLCYIVVIGIVICLIAFSAFYFGKYRKIKKFEMKNKRISKAQRKRLISDLVNKQNKENWREMND